MMLSVASSAQITLEECFRLAGDNYPLIKRYDLVSKTTNLSLSDINKGWLPKITVFGQATVQNDVTEFPEALSGLLNQMGQEFKGMGHAQYKAGLEVSQIIWDGGVSKSRRQIEDARANVATASLDVQMYAIRERVQNLYFGILLVDEQINQCHATEELLKANHSKLQSMLKGGVAMQSDVDMIEAQILTIEQQTTQAKAIRDSYCRVLELFIGESLEGSFFIKPASDLPLETTVNRPELRLLDARSKFNSARLDAIDNTTLPRVGFFGQVYYGYPGFNMFESMRSRDMSFNALAGIKISWNIDSFYTKRNSRDKIALEQSDIDTEREVFLFNNSLLTSSEIAAIDGLKKVIQDDEKIIELRARVRKAAESQLNNGVIDINGLLTKITDENIAQLNARYHEIQLIQSIYKLKYTINR